MNIKGKKSFCILASSFSRLHALHGDFHLRNVGSYLWLLTATAANNALAGSVVMMDVRLSMEIPRQNSDYLLFVWGAMTVRPVK